MEQPLHQAVNYALRRIVTDNKTHFHHEVLNTIQQNFYVDDCLKSVSSVTDAVNLVKDLTAACAKGGFQLSKWMSNSHSVLASIPEEHRSKTTKDLDLDKEHLPVERALGLHWCAELDVFIFKITVEERPHTRRGILSVLCSIYDPLGFLSSLTLPPKLLLQEMCKLKVGGDDKIPQHFSKQWSDWLSNLHQVSELKVNQCIKPSDFGQLKQAQLHHFSDASEFG